MTGSMYAAVSGLKAHMSALNVIGNNVSNVNTLGYKATRYTFNEALYTTQRSGSDGTDTVGGRNPAQVGFGASIGTIDLDMSTKNYTPTGKLLDTMIDGDGFFLVGDKTVESSTPNMIATTDKTMLKGMNLTRLGNFDIDPNGYLVDGNGSVVWGFIPTAAADAYYVSTASGQTAGVGDEAVLGENSTLPATAKRLTDMTADDVEKINTARKKNGLPELINVQYTPRKYPSGTTTFDSPVDHMNDEGYGVDKSGNIVMFVESASVASTSLSAIRFPLTETVQKLAGSDTDGYTVDETVDATVKTIWPNSDLSERDIGTVDDTTNLTRTTYARVRHNSVSINDKTGALQIMTTDGTLLTAGYLAIAKVTNPNGVTHVDGRYFQAQEGAGDIWVTSVNGIIPGTIDSGDTGIITGGLESSGTDLATEITNMITVQRGYQANTRIVTVTDSMLEELVNMKR